MTDKIRKAARAANRAWNFCLNPACLHSEKAKGCKCCSRGHRRGKSKRR